MKSAWTTQADYPERVGPIGSSIVGKASGSATSAVYSLARRELLRRAVNRMNPPPPLKSD